MKVLITFLIAILFSTLSTAQVLDNNIKNGIILPSDDNANALPSYKLDTTGDKVPEVDLKNPLNDPISFSIETTTDLLDAGEELQKRWNEDKLLETAEYDQYLGDFKTKSTYLGLQCRDFGRIDGDYVRIIVNDVVVKRSLYLRDGFQGVNIDLESGLNRIDIVAINAGQIAPNTGHFIVYNEENEIITSQMWNLHSGGKATMVILKE